MNLVWWEGLLLGMVQGLTEFLPVSSSGHLVLAEELVGFRPPGVYFEVGLHLATLLSVVIAFGPRIRELLRGIVRREGEAWRYGGMLLLASLPAAVAGIGFRDFFTARFETGIGLGVGFLVTAALLWSTRWTCPRASADQVGSRSAVVIGFAQALAILPAISRSGATISAALGAGVAPVRAAEFSFLMSIIAVAGSGLVEVRHIPSGVDLWHPGFVLAFFTALLSGIWAIRFLVRLLRRGGFHHFAWYCAGLGILTIVWYSLAS